MYVHEGHFITKAFHVVSLTIKLAANKLFLFEVVPLSSETLYLPEHKGSTSNAGLLLEASNIPPVGFTTYLVSKTAGLGY